MEFENLSEFAVKYGVYIIAILLAVWLIAAIIKKSLKLVVMIAVCLCVSVGGILLVNKLVGDVSIDVKDGIIYYQVNDNKGELDMSKILDINTEYDEENKEYTINFKYGDEGKEFDFKVNKTQYKLFFESIIEKISTGIKSLQQN